jgi:hypothetical protein
VAQAALNAGHLHGDVLNPTTGMPAYGLFDFVEKHLQVKTTLSSVHPFKRFLLKAPTTAFRYFQEGIQRKFSVPLSGACSHITDREQEYTPQNSPDDIQIP